MHDCCFSRKGIAKPSHWRSYFHKPTLECTLCWEKLSFQKTSLLEPLAKFHIASLLQTTSTTLGFSSCFQVLSPLLSCTIAKVGLLTDYLKNKKTKKTTSWCLLRHRNCVGANLHPQSIVGTYPAVLLNLGLQNWWASTNSVTTIFLCFHLKLRFIKREKSERTGHFVRIFFLVACYWGLILCPWVYRSYTRSVEGMISYIHLPLPSVTCTRLERIHDGSCWHYTTMKRPPMCRWS